MTYKQIETSREIRLWVTQIMAPLIIGGATILAADPELRAKLKDGVAQKYDAIKVKFKKN